MYAGQVAERGAVRRIFRNPAHPYTRALLESRPRRGQAKLAAIPGTVPSPLDRPSGCVFRTRCPVAVPGTCDVTAPPFVAVDGENHRARCHFAEPAFA